MTSFTIHTIENAPKKSREILKSVQEKWGFVPNVIGEIAESPALLRGFSELSEAAESGSFTREESYVVQLTISFMNNSPYCIAANTTLGEKVDVTRSVLEAIRNDRPLKDPKLEALRTFTKSVMKKIGQAEERDLAAFYKAGYKKERDIS
jgi:alkylhydroperoxidase family enzyme